MLQQIRPFFSTLAKSGFSQISSRIWQMPMQLQYVQLITDKANAADLLSGLFTILKCVIQKTKMFFLLCAI